MFQIRTLLPIDYEFAVELANTMDWNMTVEDFQFIECLEQGGSFVLVEGLKRVGIATCISYGKIGWFGNLIVDKTYRKKGSGTMLVRHSLDYLHSRGVETIGLYAYPYLKEFYSRFGFISDIDFTLLHHEKLDLMETAGAHRINESNFLRIIDFDKQWFGGDRRKLLEPIVFEDTNVGYYLSERGHIVGYIAATIYESAAWIGPMICQPSRYDVAGKLISAVLAKSINKKVYVVASKMDTALYDMFLTLGFREGFYVSRMFRGKFAAPNCIYLAESLERG